MATKSASVVARMDPEIKAEAEQILSEMGISPSTGINMFYHQVIRVHGLPFTPTAKVLPHSLDMISEEEFNQRMELGLKQAKAGLGRPVSDVFSRLRKKNQDEREAI